MTSEWIPVSERKPEIKQRVLVFVDGGITVAWRRGSYSEYNDWSGEEGHALWPPSHWMPLPEPPVRSEARAAGNPGSP